MSASNKLSTAVKALCYLAKVYPESKSSAEIAEAIGVNASKLRQILSQLMQSEIVYSTKGPTGGFLIAEDFTSLSLFEIYAALDDRKIVEFDVADASGAKDNSVKAYNDYFNNLFGDIQHQIEERMRSIKIEQIANSHESHKK
ncbi:MAG: Rrf2 family transcriptional regulator [bacterium]